MFGSCLRCTKARRTFDTGLLGFGGPYGGLLTIIRTSGQPEVQYDKHGPELSSGTNGPSPTFDVPDALAATTTYEYLLDGAVRQNVEDAVRQR